MTLSRRDKYSDDSGQKGKAESIKESKVLVSIAVEMLGQTGCFSQIERYEPGESLRVNGAPAVRVKTNDVENLAIAPDLQCRLTDGMKMWVEVKDKPQRYKYPDTGSDAHQHVGFWTIHRYQHEPVLMLFRDNPLPSSKPDMVTFSQWENFKSRWRMFAPDGMPCFYGNWLDVLTAYDETKKYPRCSFEHSRNMRMNIIYLDVYKMQCIPHVPSLRALISHYPEHMAAPDFQVWYQDKVETEPENLISV